MAEKPTNETSPTPLIPPPLSTPPTPPSSQEAISGIIEKVIGEKRSEAICLWAIQKMGKHHKAYFEQAWRNFNALFLLLYAVKYQEFRAANKSFSDSIYEIAQLVPYDIPVKLKNRKGIPPNLFDALREYEEVLERVKDCQNRKASARDKAMALTIALPGIEHKDAYNWLYPRPSRLRPGVNKIQPRRTASEIAYRYIAERYDFPTPTGATVKKVLSLARQPAKFAWRMVHDIATAAGVKISSSPPKKPKP